MLTGLQDIMGGVNNVKVEINDGSVQESLLAGLPFWGVRLPFARFLGPQADADQRHLRY